MKKKKKGGKKECGNCAFCLAKCPKCGSTNVSIRLTVEYSCQNDMKDVLMFSLDGFPGMGTLDCEDCNRYFTEQDETVRKLFDAVTSALPGNLEFVAHEDGSISVGEFKWVDATEEMKK